MADLTLPEVITRFRGNEARISDLTNGNAVGYYTTTDGKKVETLPSVVTRLAAAVAAASATRNDLAATTGSALVGHGNVTLKAYLDAQATAQSNIKATADAALPKSGGSLSGPLVLAADPTIALHPATKGWTESLVGTYWKPGIGDLLTTVRGAPDATWLPDGALYLQSSYPDLFAKLGLIGIDATTAANWTALSPAMSSQATFMAVGKDGVVLLNDYVNSANVFKRSTDGGNSFSTITPPNRGIYGGSTDGKGVFVVACPGGYIMRSADNGLTWAAIDTGAGVDLGGIGTDKKGTWIASASGAFVMRSADSGLTWTKVTAPGNSRGSVAANGSGVWIVSSSQSNVIYRSEDNGLTWGSVTVSSGPYDIGYQRTAGAGGILVAAGSSTSGGGTYIQNLAASSDGLSWRSASINAGGQGQPYMVALEASGMGIMACYSSGALRFLVATDASGVSGISLGSVPVNSSQTIAVCTDGQATWYSQSGSSYGLTKALPAYDIKTLFRVPKSLAQSAPYTTFIKAK